MLRTRSALSLALAVTLAGAGVAGAAPRPTCNLLVDPAGDVVLEGQSYDDPTLDVLGAEVASDGKRITAVLKMGAVDAVSTRAPFGRTVYFQFTAPGVRTPMYLSAHFDPVTGMFYDYGAAVGTGYTSTTATGTPASGSVDAAKKTVTISAPADLGKLMPAGAGKQLKDFAVRSTMLVGAQRAGLVFDNDGTTPTKATYTTGAPSCVAVVKG